MGKKTPLKFNKIGHFVVSYLKGKLTIFQWLLLFGIGTDIAISCISKANTNKNSTNSKTIISHHYMAGRVFMLWGQWPQWPWSIITSISQMRKWWSCPAPRRGRSPSSTQAGEPVWPWDAARETHSDFGHFPPPPPNSEVWPARKACLITQLWDDFIDSNVHSLSSNYYLTIFKNSHFLPPCTSQVSPITTVSFSPQGLGGQSILQNPQPDCPMSPAPRRLCHLHLPLTARQRRWSPTELHLKTVTQTLHKG